MAQSGRELAQRGPERKRERERVSRKKRKNETENTAGRKLRQTGEERKQKENKRSRILMGINGHCGAYKHVLPAN